MDISEELKKFIWVEFEKMKLDSIQLQVERKEEKKRKNRDRMRRTRGQETKDPTREISTKEITARGKADHPFNNFLCCVYYLTKEETKARDSHIYNYIDNFLQEQNYKNGYYDFDAIRQRVRVHYKTLDPDLKEHFEILFALTYHDFSKRHLSKK